MEYAKKMILVDPRFIEKLTSARDKVLNNIENEMDTILNSDKPDDEKAKLFAASAKRHLVINAADKETEIQREACQSTNTATVLNDIVTSMPTPHIRRAMKFAKFIQDNQINFNDRGELVHNNKVSENTNATDLLNEVIRRKQMNSTGSKEFATLLNELNCPTELIGNPSYKKYMQSGNGIKRFQSGKGIGKLKRKVCKSGKRIGKSKNKVIQSDKQKSVRQVRKTGQSVKCKKPRFK